MMLDDGYILLYRIELCASDFYRCKSKSEMLAAEGAVGVPCSCQSGVALTLTVEQARPEETVRTLVAFSDGGHIYNAPMLFR